MTKKEIIFVAAAGVLAAAGAVWYWRASSPTVAAGRGEMQKDLLTALRSDRSRNTQSGIEGNGATGWGS